MKRRLLSLLLVMLMTVTLVPMSVFAAGNDVQMNLGDMSSMVISVEDVVADIDGDTVEVGISLSRNGGFAGLIGMLVYDESKFTLESQPALSSSYGFELTGGPTQGGSHVVMLASDKNILGDGVLLTYTFKINNDVVAGKYDINFITSGIAPNGMALETVDEKGNAVANSVENGSITVPGYTVSFNANGGSGAPESLVKTKNKDLKLPSAVPVRNGYDFAGWAESASALEAEYSAGGVYSKNAEVTLYAVWKRIEIDAGTLGLEVDTVDGVIGEEVEVDVIITNNPGIGSMAFDVVYDSDVLEIKGWSDSGYPGSGNWTVSALDRYEDKLNFRFMNLNNITAEDTIITLTFLVKSTAPEGMTVVKIVPEDGEFYQFAGDEKYEIDVDVAVVDGGINAVSGELLGDVNLDETVDINDAILLLQHSMFSEDYPIDYKGSVDFTKDGNIDINDAILLLQYSMFPEDYPIA